MIVVGIDEVGRGCWAGPLVAGAVILAEPIKGLKDSKLLSKKQRDRLDAEIRMQAVAIGLGWVDAATIDRVGITTAVKLAMAQALEQITAAYDEVIIDGNLNFLADICFCKVRPCKDRPCVSGIRCEALIKADASVPAVSAASIVAKVARDNYMAKVAVDYPDYGFGQHVGYGTALHLEKLKLHGVSDLHRRSFKPVRALL